MVGNTTTWNTAGIEKYQYLLHTHNECCYIHDIYTYVIFDIYIILRIVYFFHFVGCCSNMHMPLRGGGVQARLKSFCCCCRRQFLLVVQAPMLKSKSLVSSGRDAICISGFFFFTFLLIFYCDRLACSSQSLVTCRACHRNGVQCNQWRYMLLRERKLNWRCDDTWDSRLPLQWYHSCCHALKSPSSSDSSWIHNLHILPSAPEALHTV